jgi:hypothetical protein
MRTVRTLRPCLAALPERTERVLVLRTGLGAADRLSRREVGRRIDRPVRVVRRLERRGVRQLRRAARNGECAPAEAALPVPDGAGVPAAASGATVGAGTGAAGIGGVAGAAGGAGGGDGGGDGGAGGNDGSGDSGEVKGESEEQGPIAGLVPRPPGPTDLTLPLLLVLLAGAAVFGVRAFRRYRDGNPPA